MIVGFWSERPGVGCTTSNMIIAGSMVAMEGTKEVTLIQGKHDSWKLDYAFLPKVRNDIICEDYGYYNHPGIDDVLEKHLNHLYTQKDFYENVIRVNHSNLYYLPASIRNSPELFGKKMATVSKSFMKGLRELDKLIFMEIDSGFGALSREFLEKVDMVVVNIGQSSKSIMEIIQNPYLMAKSVFLVGRYDSNSRYNVRNLIRKYGIDEACIGVIPYNVKYQDSIQEGRTMEFIDRNYRCERYDDDYEFFKEVGKATEMIMKRVV